ncbi:MAG: orotate phosphoribosyltransferase [bacterium]
MSGTGGTSDRERLRNLLIEKSVRFGEFTLTSGRKSNHYIDAKQTTLDPLGARLTASVVLERLEGVAFDALGGPTLGADPILGAAAAESHRRGRPFPVFIVRKEPKKHGAARLIEGPLPPGARVVLMDDVVTTGGSLLRAARAVEELGCTVVMLVSLVDRLEAKDPELSRYRYDPVFTAADLGIETG